MKILVIEDEAELRRSIKEYLHNEGYVVESANDFKTASERTGVYQYDCVLVDITLPNGNGLDIVKQLKKKVHKQASLLSRQKSDKKKDN